MSTITRCDGCGNELDPASHQVVIHGHRADASNAVGRQGDHTKADTALPNTTFDWCRPCARTAFNAVLTRPAGRQ